MERIAVDILGPLPKTNDGNQYIVIAQDYFTKWPEAFPVADQKATTVADVLVNQFFTRFGIPQEFTLIREGTLNQRFSKMYVNY